MSGHNKWSQIKYKKAASDAQKGRLFTKLGNAITIAVRQGGGDPEANFRLKTAIEKAKEANMPSQNIERAIKRGLGEIEGAKIEELFYEGFGPGGIAILCHVVTDNKNRAINEIRSILNRYGGKLASEGAVSRLFVQKGIIVINPADQTTPFDKEEIELAAIDAGAEDVREEGETILVCTKPNELFLNKQGLEAKGIKIESAQLSMEPINPIKIEDKQQVGQILKLMDALGECPDVSNLYANFDIPDEMLGEFKNGAL